MTQNLGLKLRSYFAGFMVVALFAVLAAQQQQVQAGSSSGDLGRDIAEDIDSYQQGNADGRVTGIADYPYRNSDCPSGHSTAYCLGWDG